MPTNVAEFFSQAMNNMTVQARSDLLQGFRPYPWNQGFNPDFMLQLESSTAAGAGGINIPINVDWEFHIQVRGLRNHE